MALDEKEQLLRSEDRFTSLPSEEQLDVRRLHKDLQDDPYSARLRAIMHDYYEWLKPLSPLSWAELAEMGPEDRVAWMKKRFQEEQRREGGRRPGPKDMEALWKWMSDFARRHEASFLASLSEAQQKRFAGVSKPMQHQMAIGLMLQRWQAPNSGKLPPIMTEEDLAQPLAKISPETRNRLKDKPPAEQWQLMAGWMAGSDAQGPRRFDEDRRMRGPLPKDDDERLAEFFEKDLSPEERDRLLAMPGEEIQWRLQQMYLMRAEVSAGRAGLAARRHGAPTDAPAVPSGRLGNRATCRLLPLAE